MYYLVWQSIYICVVRLNEGSYKKLQSNLYFWTLAGDSKGMQIIQNLGPLHVFWQVSFGCWVTWSISSWQKYYKSVFLPKEDTEGEKNFFWLLTTEAWTFCKKMLSILSDSPLNRKTEKTDYFSIIILKIDQNINFAKLPSAK